MSTNFLMNATHRVLSEVEGQLQREREECRRDWGDLWNPVGAVACRLSEDYAACASYLVKTENLDNARHWYLKLAALAVDAVEAIDRQSASNT